MVNDKYLYLIQLCMELQRGEDGRIEERMADEKPGPTAFAWFGGHTTCLYISIYFDGWTDEHGPDEDFRFNLSLKENRETEQKFRKCRDILLSLLKKEGKHGIL